MSDNGTIVLDGLVLSGGGSGGGTAGGYLQAYNFGVATPTETQLNDYALSQIPSISNPSDIFNGTRVKNLFDNHLWILTNTPNTVPAVLDWADNGYDTVGIATESTAGVVKASSTSGGISVAADGTASVNGFNNKFDKTGGVLSGDISIEKASADTSIINLKSGTVNSILSSNSSGIFLYRTYNNRLAYNNSANKWYVYKLGVAKELGLTDASELSYSGPVSASTVKGAIEEVDAKAVSADAKAEAVAGDLADTKVNGVAIAGKDNTSEDLGLQSKLNAGNNITKTQISESAVKLLLRFTSENGFQDISASPLTFSLVGSPVYGDPLFANSTNQSLRLRAEYNFRVNKPSGADWSKMNIGTGPFTIKFRRKCSNATHSPGAILLSVNRTASSYNNLYLSGQINIEGVGITPLIPITLNAIEEILITRLDNGIFKYYKNGQELGTSELLNGVPLDFSDWGYGFVASLESVEDYISGFTLENKAYTGGNYTPSEDYPTSTSLTKDVIACKNYFGSLYTEDNTTAQTIPTGTDYTKLTALNTAGEYRGITLDAANNKMTLTSAGYYRIGITASSKLGTAGVTLKTALFLGGVKVPSCQAVRKINNANDESTVSFGGIIKVDTANSDIDVRVSHDNGGDVSLTTVFCSLNALYIGDL